MAVYCEPRPDLEVFDEIGDAKRILLVGCPSCANVSYSIHKELPKELPIYKFTLTGIKAVYTKHEIDRMADLFAQKGLHVDSWLPNAPAGICVLDEGARRNLFNRCRDINTIIALCCDSGTKNVEDILPGKKVVGAMNARGLLTAVTKTKMKIWKTFIDKETLYVEKFVFE